jgi:hypothetical protein
MIPHNLILEKVEIYNPLGQLIALKNTKNFSIADLSTGMLWVKIYTNDGVVIKNLLKK